MVVVDAPELAICLVEAGFAVAEEALGTGTIEVLTLDSSPVLCSPSIVEGEVARCDPLMMSMHKLVSWQTAGKMTYHILALRPHPAPVYDR